MKWTRLEGCSFNPGQEGIEHLLEKRTVAGRKGRNKTSVLQNSKGTADVDSKIRQLDRAVIHCLMQLAQGFSDR